MPRYSNSAGQTSKPAKPAASLTPSDTILPTIPPITSGASSPTLAPATPSSSAVTSAVTVEGTGETAPKLATATLMPTLSPYPTVANVAPPTLPTLAPLATLAPTVVASSGQLVPGVAKQKAEASEEAILMGQGGHDKSSLSDGLSIGSSIWWSKITCSESWHDTSGVCFEIFWADDEEVSYLEGMRQKWRLVCDVLMLDSQVQHLEAWESLAWCWCALGLIAYECIKDPSDGLRMRRKASFNDGCICRVGWLLKWEAAGIIVSWDE